MVKDLVELFKWLTPDIETVGKTNTAIFKCVYWLNCAALTIYFVGALGYKLDETFTLNTSELIKVFSRYQLVLGTMFYMLVIYLIEAICNALTGVFLFVYERWYFTRKQPLNPKKQGYIQSMLNHKVAEDNDTLSERAKIAGENALSIKIFIEMALTFPLVYGFVISENFPNAYRHWVAILMWLSLTFPFLTKAKMKFLDVTKDAWQKEIDKYLKTVQPPQTTSTTTATTTLKH